MVGSARCKTPKRDRHIARHTHTSLAIRRAEHSLPHTRSPTPFSASHVEEEEHHIHLHGLRHDHIPPHEKPWPSNLRGGGET